MIRQRTGSISSQSTTEFHRLHRYKKETSKKWFGRTVKIASKAYKDFMDFGVNDYLINRLPSFVLTMIAYLILLVFPAKVKFSKRVPRKDNKILFVVNHNIAALDVAVLFSVIYLETGIYPRGLADRFCTSYYHAFG
jgi:hypothetical protein